MKLFIEKQLSSGVSVVLIALFLLVAASSSAFAHGKEHQPDGGMSKHMKSMMGVKDKVPEEYRIMDRTPVLPSAEALQQGENLFMQNCSVCHGAQGDGKGPAAAAMATPPANFLDKKHSAMYGPGEKYWIIGNGSGETGMPAFPRLTPVQRWYLVNHILQLQQGK